MILPIAVTGAAGPVGVVVIGVNPYRPVDDGYLEFAELAARQFGIIVGDALTLRQELSRRRALADADQAKTQFLQQVSHELRSPLTLLLPPLIDLLSDPPPAQGLALITCRNVVIYFDRPSQGPLLQRFHDALVPGGYLVLGKVETLLGEARRLFEVVDARNRIFRRVAA